MGIAEQGNVEASRMRGDGSMRGKQTTREQHLLDFIDPDELNDWEEEFYWSVKEQFEERGRLSEKQIAVLERIYEKGG